MVNEHRSFPREACTGTAEVQFSVGAPRYTAEILNLSVEGCLLLFEEPVCVARECAVEVIFHVNRLPFRVKATVKSSRLGLSLGFHFPALSDRIRLRLDAMMTELEEDALEQAQLKTELRWRIENKRR